MTPWPNARPGPADPAGPVPPPYGPPPRGGAGVAGLLIVSAAVLLLLGTCIGGAFTAVGVLPDAMIRDAARQNPSMTPDMVRDVVAAKPKLLVGGLLTMAVGLVGGVALLALLPGVRRGDRGRTRAASRVALGIGGLLLGLAVGGVVTTPAALTGVCCATVGGVLLLATGIAAEVARRRGPAAATSSAERDDPWNAF